MDKLNQMTKQLNCRKGINKHKFQCKIRKFCNKPEGSISIVGKSALSLISPTTRAVITYYDIGKSVSCDLYKRLK